MFDSLSEKLQNIIQTTSSKKLDEDNMADALREVRRALLEADVNLKVVRAFISTIKDRADGEQILKGVNASQQLVKIVYDEMTKLLGSENKPLSTAGSPNLIMLFGLQGSGKTTSAAKLALRLRKDGRNPLLVAADVYRPAAIKQLQTLGKQIGVDVFTIDGSTDVRDIVAKAIDYAKEKGFNSVIIDTAGRLQIDTEMMAELVLIERFYNPAEKLLVIDSMTGQEAINVAQTFNEQLDITGIILTKLDGDARGGAALSVVHSTGKPIKFTGMGEKIVELDPFYPDRMAQRILGMGDIISLVEKAQEKIDLEQAKEMEKKMFSKEFSLEDFMNIQKQMKMLGSLDQIMGMLPILGISKKDKDQIAHLGEKHLKQVESIIQSMTPQERKKPDILNGSRRKRIAKGCGLDVAVINKFLKDFENMKKMMQQFNKMKGNLGALKGKRLPHQQFRPPIRGKRF